MDKKAEPNLFPVILQLREFGGYQVAAAEMLRLIDLDPGAATIP